MDVEAIRMLLPSADLGAFLGENRAYGSWIFPETFGLSVPNSQKEVRSTATLEPIKPAEQLISVEEASKIGCVQRLNGKGLSALDMKRIRLTISALKSYIFLYSQVTGRM